MAPGDRGWIFTVGSAHHTTTNPKRPQPPCARRWDNAEVCRRVVTATNQGAHLRAPFCRGRSHDGLRLDDVWDHVRILRVARLADPWLRHRESQGRRLRKLPDRGHPRAARGALRSTLGRRRQDRCLSSLSWAYPTDRSGLPALRPGCSETLRSSAPSALIGGLGRWRRFGRLVQLLERRPTEDGDPPSVAVHGLLWNELGRRLPEGGRDPAVVDG